MPRRVWLHSGFAWAFCPPVTPQQGLGLAGHSKISMEIHQHPLQGTQLGFALSQASTSAFATKADSRKIELRQTRAYPQNQS